MPIIEKYDQEFSQSSIEDHRGRPLYHPHHNADDDNIENRYVEDVGDGEDDECVHRSALKARRGNNNEQSTKKRRGFKNEREEFEAIEHQINIDNNNNRIKKVR